MPSPFSSYDFFPLQFRLYYHKLRVFHIDSIEVLSYTMVFIKNKMMLNLYEYAISITLLSFIEEWTQARQHYISLHDKQKPIFSLVNLKAYLTFHCLKSINNIVVTSV